jgi:hypothetical protein
MSATPHIERHFTATETVRDVVIGMSDGLTVPFALAAGLSGAVKATGIVVTAGPAEELFLFGFVKERFTAINPWRGGVQTVFIGGLAAATAFAIARLIG